MHTICNKNMKLKRNVTENRCEIQQKFSETMNVSIRLLKKPTEFLNSITKYMKKYTK